jgi:uncharacterized protein YciI
MFIMSLTYTAEPSAVDAVRGAHMDWIREQFAAGHFVASGAKIPRDGGVIIAHGVSRGEVEALVAADPFTQAGVCTYEVTEFRATTVADDFPRLREHSE